MSGRQRVASGWRRAMEPAEWDLPRHTGRPRLGSGALVEIAAPTRRR